MYYYSAADGSRSAGLSTSYFLQKTGKTILFAFTVKVVSKDYSLKKKRNNYVLYCT